MAYPKMCGTGILPVSSRFGFSPACHGSARVIAAQHPTSHPTRGGRITPGPSTRGGSQL
jgi:hypothetical protein